MKKILLLLLICKGSFSQIQIQETPKEEKLGEVRQSGTFVADIHYYLHKQDTSCTLMFQNQQYKSISDIQYFSFSSDGNTLNTFYSLLKSCLTEENKDNKSFKVEFQLGKTFVILSPAKSMFNGHWTMIWTEKGYFYLTSKQIDQLFNKG